MAEKSSFGILKSPCRIWAVSSVHGEAGRLQRLNALLSPRIAPQDRLVFLGNVVGRGAEVRETVDALLLFRREFLARPGNDVPDIALLRGAQEEMLHRLFELQFAVNPTEVLSWMLDHGAGPTIEAYGCRAADGLAAARQGTVALGRWTAALREAVRNVPGHRDFLSALRQAAYTSDGAMVLVSAGIDPDRPLDAQADTLWWDTQSFERIEAPYFGCQLVVRGFDPGHRGVVVTDHTVSIDAGCGFGGPLLAACVTPQDGIIEVIEA